MSKVLRNVFALTAVALMGVAGTVAPAAATASDTCIPPCYKDPVTGQIYCGHPCP